MRLETRKKCSQRKEEDENRYDKLLYLNFLDLKGIFSNRWSLFQSDAERLKKFPGKTQLLNYFQQLNNLRNQIMHPLKRKPLGQDDVQTLRNFSDMVNELISNL